VNLKSKSNEKERFPPHAIKLITSHTKATNNEELLYMYVVIIKIHHPKGPIM